MARILYLFIAVVLVASCARDTDNPTEAELFGTWKFVSLTDKHGSVDLVAGTVKVNDSLSGTQKKAYEEDYSSIVKFLEKARFTFTAGKMTLSNGVGKEKSSTFVIEQKEGKSYIKGDQMLGNEPTRVFLKESRLHMVHQNAGEEFILIKE